MVCFGIHDTITVQLSTVNAGNSGTHVGNVESYLTRLLSFDKYVHTSTIAINGDLSQVKLDIHKYWKGV